MDRALLERMIGAIALVLLLVIVAPALLDGTRESSSDRLTNAQDDQDVRTEIIVLNEPRDPEVLQAPSSAANPLQPDVIAANKSAPSGKAEESPVAVAPAVNSSEAQIKIQAPTPAPTPAPTQTPASAPAGVSAPTLPSSTGVVRNESMAVSRPDLGGSKMSKAPAEKTEQTLASADTVNAANFAVQLGSFGQAENAQKYVAELGAKGFTAFVRSSGSATGEIHRVFAGPRPSRDDAQQLATALDNAGYRGLVVELSAGNGMR